MIIYTYFSWPLENEIFLPSIPIPHLTILVLRMPYFKTYIRKAYHFINSLKRNISVLSVLKKQIYNLYWRFGKESRVFLLPNLWRRLTWWFVEFHLLYHKIIELGKMQGVLRFLGTNYSRVIGKEIYPAFLFCENPLGHFSNLRLNFKIEVIRQDEIAIKHSWVIRDKKDLLI